MRRRRVGSYTDLGPVQIPPLPQNIVMQDRVTFEMYFLTQTGDPGSLDLLLSTVVPSQPDTVFYGPYAGPYLNGNIRLYVESGILLGELVGPDANFQQRVLTRRGSETILLEVTAPVGWRPGDALLLEEIEL